MRYQLRYIRTLPGALPAPCCEKNTSRRCWCTQIAWLRQETNYNDAIRWVSERRLRARWVGAEPSRVGWSAAAAVFRGGGCRSAPAPAVMTSRFSTPAAGVLVFSSFRRERHACERSRGSVGERPLHTRKVAGSIPAGTTTERRFRRKPPRKRGLSSFSVSRCVTRASTWCRQHDTRDDTKPVTARSPGHH